MGHQTPVPAPSVNKHQYLPMDHQTPVPAPSVNKHQYLPMDHQTPVPAPSVNKHQYLPMDHQTPVPARGSPSLSLPRGTKHWHVISYGSRAGIRHRQTSQPPRAVWWRPRTGL
ncbi:hypothetical protein BgiBS90_005854 [Biomphalaria glabrata]|nr:hypothetical protein BgiBS90_005854 [Biomphalaria glabrata]